MKEQTLFSAIIYAGIGAALFAAPGSLAVSPERAAPKLNFEQVVAGFALGFEGDIYPAIEIIDPNSQACKAGLTVGDRIVSLDGKIAAFMGQDELRVLLVSDKPKKLKVEAERDGQLETFVIDMSPAKELADTNLAARLLDTSPFYPVRRQPLKAGYYAIDLPSFLRSEAAEGPLLIEFYDKKDDRVEKLVGRYNSMVIRQQLPVPPYLCSLISLSLKDRDTEPLRKHFRINSRSFVFIPANDVTIKDFVDVVRHDLSEEQIIERLQETALTREVTENMMQVVHPEMAARWRELTNQAIELEGAAK